MVGREGGENVAHVGRKTPKILLIGEFLLAVVLFRYLLNFTSMVSPIEGSWLKVAVNLISIVLSLMLTILTVNSILGIPSARPQSWRVVVRASVILFITNFIYGFLEDMGLISTGIVFRIEYVGIIVVLVDIIMFLPSVRKYYTPPLSEIPPLKKWFMYLFNIPLIDAESYKFIYDGQAKDHNR
ncbi:hypothetical protein AUP07_0254 [methanogenic archaeon mixed culture ISO4-G1]|nr:hypothetical protein AUP07_0254 [methanogenic archaeon mixed culture ISO4-G1]